MTRPANTARTASASGPEGSPEWERLVAECDWIDIHVVDHNLAGCRLDQYLTERLRRTTRSQVSQIIADGRVFVDRRPARGSRRVKIGDRVEIPRVERADPTTPELSSVGRLAERDTIIVLNKPPGLLVHRSAHEATRTVERYLQLEWPNERVETVHRIDRDTSGCLVCARGIESIREAKLLFETGAVTKQYSAVVSDPGGAWQPGDERTFDTPLGLDPSSRLNHRMGRGDLECSTRCVCVRRSANRALLDVWIDHGRQHQIRVHLWMFGTPICGDKLYQMGDAFFMEWSANQGAPELVAMLECRWHALHAAGVTLNWRGERLEVVAEPPLRFAALLDGVEAVTR